MLPRPAPRPRFGPFQPFWIPAADLVRSAASVGAALALMAPLLTGLASKAHALEHQTAAPPAANAKVPPRPTAAPATHRPQLFHRVKNAHEQARMASYLKTRTPAAEHVKHSFVAEAGHTIDCVAVEHQPAMLRPELRGHTLLKPPPASFAPARALPGKGLAHAPKGYRAPAKPSAAATGLFFRGGTDAQRKSRACPQGTVPHARKTLEELTAFATLEEYHSKLPRHLVRGRFASARNDPDGASERAAPTVDGGAVSSHDHAHVENQSLVNYGVHTVMSVISAYVMVGHREFSLSQLWLVAVDPVLGEQTLEAGIQSDPDRHHGDARPRFFAFSTTNGYQHYQDREWWKTHNGTSCYDLECGQFVQVDPTFDFSAPVQPGEIDVAYVKYGEAWWLRVQNRWIGYYPASLYSEAGLRNRATTIDFGGEVVNNRDAAGHGHPNWHTTSGMGTGGFPEAAYPQAAYQRQLGYFASADGKDLTPAHGLEVKAKKPGCYRASTPVEAFNFNPTWGTYFFFGGPGYSFTSDDCKL